MFQKVDPSTQRHDFHPTVKTEDAGYQMARSLPLRYAVPQCRGVMRSSTPARSVAHPLKQGRGSREGGGQWGQLAPTTWKLWPCGGTAPLLWTVNQTCPWIPKMDPGIWSQGSGSRIRSDHRSNPHSLRQIHWDHRSSFVIRQEILSDPRSKTPYCCGIHRDPISDKRNSRIFYALF